MKAAAAESFCERNVKGATGSGGRMEMKLGRAGNPPGWERESVTAGECEDSCVFLMNTWVLSLFLLRVEKPELSPVHFEIMHFPLWDSGKRKVPPLKAGTAEWQSGCFCEERKEGKKKGGRGQLSRQAFESQLSSSALLKRNFVTALSLHPMPGQPFRLSAHECKAEGLVQL